MRKQRSKKANANSNGPESGSSTGNNRKRGGGNGAGKVRAEDDRRLIERCLAGDEQAWSELYRQQHPGLLKATKFVLGSDGKDPHLVEEIAARVWYAVVRDGGRVLAGFDPQRDRRLGVFLTGVARLEAKQQLRTDARRRARERARGRQGLGPQTVSPPEAAAVLNEFADSLTACERDFLDKFLLTPVNGEDSTERPSLTPANRWQLRHRISQKVRRFLGGV